MFGFGRPRRDDLPLVNYEESSESEEDLESELNFNSPLTSSQRPVPTREGSPVKLAHPTLNDNIDEVLDEVTVHLADHQQVEEEIKELTNLLEDTDTRVSKKTSQQGS